MCLKPTVTHTGSRTVAAAAAFAAPGSATAAAPLSYGQPQGHTVGASGCETDTAGAPTLHMSKANFVGLGSENEIGGVSVFSRAAQVGGSGSGR